MKNAARPSQVHAAFKEQHFPAGNFNPLPVPDDSPLPQLSKVRQHAVILKALRTADRTTDYFRSVGVYVLGVRIWELRLAGGYGISMTMVPVISMDGRRRKVALYRLTEPSAEELQQPASEERPDCPEYTAWMAGPDKGSL